MENFNSGNSQNFEDCLKLNGELLAEAAKVWKKSQNKYFLISFAMEKDSPKGEHAIQLSGANISRQDLYVVMMAMNTALCSLHDEECKAYDAAGGFDNPQLPPTTPPTKPGPSITEF